MIKIHGQSRRVSSEEVLLTGQVVIDEFPLESWIDEGCHDSRISAFRSEFYGFL